jgi:hypothetical protein
LIVTSDAYQRSSILRPEASSIDPDNRLIWRGPSGRLDAETFRDSLLALAHSLDEQTGGPPRTMVQAQAQDSDHADR